MPGQAKSVARPSAGTYRPRPRPPEVETIGTQRPKPGNALCRMVSLAEAACVPNANASNTSPRGVPQANRPPPSAPRYDPSNPRARSGWCQDHGEEPGPRITHGTKPRRAGPAADGR